MASIFLLLVSPLWDKFLSKWFYAENLISDVEKFFSREKSLPSTELFCLPHCMRSYDRPAEILELLLLSPLALCMARLLSASSPSSEAFLTILTAESLMSVAF